CHFWSNFEIADLNLWRSEAYLKYFDFLDKKGGFFYERWGDAPVHSIAAVLFLKKHQVHFFKEIGYKHEPFTHCPSEEELQLKCHCDPSNNFDFEGYSCTGRFLELVTEWNSQKLLDNTVNN
ncbi:6314_t:CDS:2, partial [Dentiscutata heterogama]